MGSLFWIHGKRTRFFHVLLVTHTHAAGMSLHSGVWQEYFVVSDS